MNDWKPCTLPLALSSIISHFPVCIWWMSSVIAQLTQICQLPSGERILPTAKATQEALKCSYKTFSRCSLSHIDRDTLAKWGNEHHRDTEWEPRTAWNNYQPHSALFHRIIFFETLKSFPYSPKCCRELEILIKYLTRKQKRKLEMWGKSQITETLRKECYEIMN